MDQLLDIINSNRDKIFYCQENNNITYQQSLYGIYNFVNWFLSQKIINKRIILNLENSVRSHLFFLAALHTNDVLLLPPGHTDGVMDYLYHNGFQTVITAKGCPDLDITNTKLPKYQRVKNHCFLLSSGTTGSPKIIKLDYSQLIDYGRGLENFFTINETDRFYNLVPFYHGFGLTRLFTILFSGSSQAIPSSLSVEKICQDININRCTWTSFVPRLVMMLNRRSFHLWSGFNFSTSSASLINVDNQKKFESLSDRPLFVEYGCTEAGIISSNNFESQVYGSLGVPSVSTEIRNDTLWVKPNWRGNQKWVDTGDIVEIKNGNLWLMGRYKEIIKKNGRTIFPSEIENSIIKISGVEEAVAYARDPMTDQESIGLIYTGSISSEDIKKYCDKFLSPILRPDHISHVTNIPYCNNKIKRQDLQSYVDSL